MKHSGVPWLGDVPAEWEVVRVGRILTEINRRSDLGTEEPLSMSQKYGIVPSKMIDVANPASSFIGAKIVSPGDIVLNKLKAHLGVFAISKFKGLVSPDYAVYRANEGVSAEYYNYVFHSPRCISEFRRRITGVAVGFNRLYTSDLFKIEVPFPPLTEQRRIAAFLDGVVAKIDGIRDGIQREIERLGDYRKSLVAEAVTGKRNSDSSDSLANARQKRNVSGASDKSEFEKRPMKPSGIPWLGDVPAEWELCKGKYFLRVVERPVRDDDGVITCFRDGEVTLRSKRREEGFTVALKEMGYQGVEPGDLVVHGMDGFAGAIGVSDSRGKASPVLVVLDTDQNKRFVMYYLRSVAYKDVFAGLSTGIRVRSCDLRWNKLANLPFLLPPLPEQRRIAAYLDKATAQIDAAVEVRKGQLEKLEALKKTIIAEYTTGKKEVLS